MIDNRVEIIYNFHPVLTRFSRYFNRTIRISNLSIEEKNVARFIPQNK